MIERTSSISSCSNLNPLANLLRLITHQILSCILILLPVTYFLAPTATVSFFPSYLIGIFGLIALATSTNHVFKLRLSLSIVIVLCLTLLMSNHVAGFELLITAKYFGYELLILTFIIGFLIVSIEIPWFLTTFMVVTVGAALVSAIFSIGFYFYLDYQPLVENRLYALGRLQNPVISAISYGSILCLCLSLIATTKEKGLRTVTILIALTLVVAILLTGTRGAWIGLAAAVASIIFFRPWRSRRQLVISLMIFAGLIGLIGTILYLTGYADAITKRSFSFRPEIWQATIDHWLAGNLLIGSGLHSVIDLYIPPNTFQHPHSIYFSTLYYGGIIGLACLFAVIGRMFWVLGNRADTQVRDLAFPLLAFGVTTLSFDGNKIIEKVDFLWFCFWLPIALTLVAELRYKNQSVQES